MKKLNNKEPFFIWERRSLLQFCTLYHAAISNKLISFLPCYPALTTNENEAPVLTYFMLMFVKRIKESSGYETFAWPIQ